jgi:low temperature requirement protein LtrA
VRRFALLSVGGLAAVAAGGVVQGDARAWWWAAAVLLDVAAAVAAGAAEGWDVRPDHFSERHGLFVIIALGESLIVAGAGLTGAERTPQTVAVAILAVAVTCGLWWSYFVTAKPLLDKAIRQRDQAARTHLARDVYSIGHFPVVFGVVLLAVALQEAVAHPHQALPAGGSLALAGGVVLFVGGTAAALRRSGTALSGRQLVLCGAVAAVSGSPTAHRSPGRCSWSPSDSSCWAWRSERQRTRRDELERGTVASEVARLNWRTQH